MKNREGPPTREPDANTRRGRNSPFSFYPARMGAGINNAVKMANGGNLMDCKYYDGCSRAYVPQGRGRGKNGMVP